MKHSLGLAIAPALIAGFEMKTTRTTTNNTKKISKFVVLICFPFPNFISILNDHCIGERRRVVRSK
jgi:K+-transporting ATPase A subunit